MPGIILFICLLRFELMRAGLMRGGIPTEMLALFAKKVNKLIHLSYNELLDMKQNLLGRKFAHGP